MVFDELQLAEKEASMSQKIVLELLTELGGRATTRALTDLAEKKYPGSCYSELMTDRLNKLHKWGTVNYDAKAHEWYIVKALEA